ncbi:hypothetical protein CH63R_13856 [Colletotrichum higginsianum IMI 349063]|uniref:Nucleoporin nup49 n=3 Tax=Colletotrichum higginsianum TaxID=80884 RepID=A0A1B7XS97_COLHI|nr:hypothetical protein CH63R_13856 [Colletotrichum higginsianum IMI 349063]OBR02630.1 hypothetical protein CH63R_13856 [Colletotrichum higginsianum IMI 349063]TID06729.1 hypothetical protein CH35J_000357 [Colletotrichum higginsianum]
MTVENPEPAEYALFHGLFADSETYFLELRRSIVELSQNPECTSSTVDLGDPPEVQPLMIPEPLFPSESDYHNTAAEEILADIVKVHNQREVFKLALESTFSGIRFSRAVHKFEVPLLKSDPRHDLKALARNMAETRLHDFFCKPNTLPLEPVDDQKDEGLGLPSSAMHFHGQLTRGAEPDELDFSEEDILYVAESLYDDWGDEDLERLIDEEVGSTIKRVRAITPPLIAPALNDSDEEEVFVPSAEVCEIDPLSSPSSLLSEDLEQARNQLHDEDDDDQVPEASTSDIIGLYSDTPSFEIFTPKHPRENLVMEVPILPMSDDGISRGQEEEAFQGLVERVSGLPCFNPVGPDREIPIDEGESSFDEQFNLLIKDKANGITNKLEQEQIEVIDAIARMRPPILDFSTPTPDWQGVAQDPSAMFAWIRRKHGHQYKPPQWPRNPREQRDLRWIPFPVSLAHANVRESVGDARVLQELLGSSSASALPTSADYVHRRRRLKALAENDDEELPLPCEDDHQDQQFSLLEPEDDFMDLIRKRKTAHVAEGEPTSLISPTEGVKSRRKAKQMNATKILGDGLLLGENDANATERLLSNYMDFRTIKRHKPSLASLTNTSGASCQLMSKQTPQNTQKPQAHQPERRIVLADAPCPHVDSLEEPPRIVISVCLPRCIISALQAKIPGIDLVDRDFTRHNTWAWSSGSTRRVEVDSPLSYEADIIPSPATGIIITTILKIRQKPLPGSQAQLSQIRHRLVKVAPLYERLIVLVSEGNLAGEHASPLDGADAEAYASFVAFASSLGSRGGCSIRAIYVGGGNHTLASWTCALIATHVKEAASNVQQILMPEETEWEVFLRRAGLNMYAAQVALAVVKGTYPEDGQDRTLVRFLGMSPAERADMLQEFLGGRDLVDRVSARLG